MSYSLENSIRESIFREDLFLYNCLQETFLTLEEMMKDKYLAKIFEGKMKEQRQSPLLTTEKGDSFDLPRGGDQSDGF